MNRYHIIALCVVAGILWAPRCTDNPRCDEDLASTLAERISAAKLDDVEITYQWKQGYGRGDVELQVVGAGESRLILHEYGGDEQTEYAEIPARRVIELLEVLKDSGVACAQTQVREVCVTDIGKTIVGVQLGGLRKELYWDEYRYTKTAGEVDAVFERLYALEELFGVAFDWGPRGSAKVPCPDEIPPRYGAG